MSDQQWPSFEAAIRYHLKEGWIHGECKCGKCGYEWTGLVWPDPETWKNLDCPHCRHQGNVTFTPGQEP